MAKLPQLLWKRLEIKEVFRLALPVSVLTLPVSLQVDIAEDV